MQTMLNAIRDAIPPIHPEGHKFILIFAVATLILGWIWDPFGWVGLGLTIWCALFFRDPPRATPVDSALVISPADGKVSAIVRAKPPSELGLGDAPLTRVSVFMNVFNVHVNRAPIAGKISRIEYTPGAFLSADLDKASEANERNGLVIHSDHGDIGVVQIAGLVARRIVCWVEPEEEIAVGERFGMIRFGSRLDVFLPDDAAVKVAVGQTAVAGETPLASFAGDEAMPTSARIS